MGTEIAIPNRPPIIAAKEPAVAKTIPTSIIFDISHYVTIVK